MKREEVMSVGILAQIQELPKLDRKERLASYIKGEFKKALYIDENDSIPVEISIFDLGLTSLGAETLKQRFEQELQCRIDTTDFFANPTIDYFINSLSARLLGDGHEVERTDEGADMRNMVKAMLSAMYGES